MFTRLLRRIGSYNYLWAEIANPRERRVAGMLIAFFGR